MNRKILLAALFSCASAININNNAAFAQQAGSEPAEPTMQQQAATAGNVSDVELRQFMDAQRGIMALREEYTAKLQNADGEQAQQQVQMQANAAMTSAVKEAGIEVQDFNQIAMALQSDEQLRNRYMEMAQQAQTNESE
jgi:hypothetical protein